MDLQKAKTPIEILESKRKLSTCGIKIPRKSMEEVIEIFINNGGVKDEKLAKIDPAIYLDDHCVDIVAASKNGGVSRADLETNKVICRVLRYIIDEQKKKLMDENTSDDEDVLQSSMEYKRAIEVICFASKRIIPLKRTKIRENNIDKIKEELAFLKEVGALSK